MQAVPGYMCALVTAAIIASVSGADAQDNKLLLPNVTVTAPPAPVEPPYMRDPGKAYARDPYLGRYRVEEDKFPEVPCAATRIARAQVANVYKDIGSPLPKLFQTDKAAVFVTWHSTW